jgi:hypothetical protein
MFFYDIFFLGKNQAPLKNILQIEKSHLSWQV